MAMRAAVRLPHPRTAAVFEYVSVSSNCLTPSCFTYQRCRSTAYFVHVFVILFRIFWTGLLFLYHDYYADLSNLMDHIHGYTYLLCYV